MVKGRIGRFALVLVSLGLLAVVLAACGGSGAGQSNNGSSGGNASAGSEHSGGGPVKEVKIASSAFEPQSVTVKAGTTIMFSNEDGTDHQVHDDADAFKSEILGQGGKHHQTYDAPGTYTYHCHLHAGMKGTIVVE